MGKKPDNSSISPDSNGRHDGKNFAPRRTREEFIAEIQETVLDDLGIRVTVNDRRINRIIREAKTYFYDEYDESWEEIYIYINPSAFKTPLFRSRRQIELPDCISEVFQVTEANSHMSFAGYGLDGDYKKERFHVGRAALGGSGNMVYGLAMEYYASFVNQFDVKEVSADFNANTNRLTILGRDPKISLFCRVAANIEEEYLMRDNVFFRYVLGRAYKSVSTALGVFDFQLIGGTSINKSEIKALADENLDYVEKRLDEQKGNAGFWLDGDQSIG